MKTKFKAHEVCRMLGISKSTLLRWESEQLIPKPSRSLIGVRLYAISDIKGILDSPCASKCRDSLKLYIKDLHTQADVLLELL